MIYDFFHFSSNFGVCFDFLELIVLRASGSISPYFLYLLYGFWDNLR